MIFCLIVNLCFHPTRALTRNLILITASPWVKFCYINYVCTTLHIYIFHSSHNFVEESSSIQYLTYCMIEKGTHKNTTHSHLLGIVSQQLNEFSHYSSSNLHHIQFTKYIFFGICFTNLSKEPNNNMISLFQKVFDTFGRTKEGKNLANFPRTTETSHG